MGGQPSHKDPQEGSQDPRHPMKVVYATCVLDFEFGLKDGLEDRTPVMSLMCPPSSRPVGEEEGCEDPLPCSGPEGLMYREELVPQCGDGPSQEASCQGPKGCQHHFS